MHNVIHFIPAFILLTQVSALFLLIIIRQTRFKKSESITFKISSFSCLLCFKFLSFLIFYAIFYKVDAQIINLGSWFGIEKYKYKLLFVVDRISLTYSFFSLSLVTIIAFFSRRYLHRESGYHRFYILMLLFLFGLTIVSFAGTMEILIVGWEFVGLSSVLLISFFNYRASPVKNSFWVFNIYRITDLGLLFAALVMHNCCHSASFSVLKNSNFIGISSENAPLILCYLILFSAMGKAALFPFSGWLARAMEGPTPSSAIFYGAISVHLGPLLLLRSSDLINAYPTFAYSVIFLGLLTSIISQAITAVQTDIKSTLAFSSVTQLGIIVAEIGFGLNGLALLHIIGHSGFRSLQILRSPNLINERKKLEQMLGHHVSHRDITENKQNEYSRLKYFIYRFAIERGFLDITLKSYIIPAFIFPFELLNKLENKWSKLFITKK
jgi:NAD(P)H-quinone oxidoreductase subunit 5